MATVKRQLNLNDFASDSFSKADSSKRRRTLTEQDYSAFAPGSIIKIKVKNFVTYATAEFVLSPSLNMIIGPNGTGKSTFVCALCLGLAGSPQLLGRQKTIESFIKNGEESGQVEVTLKNKGEERNIVVTRDIYMKNKSDWKINSKPSNETRVKALLSTFNIQLDNLCQFLPQEKVADFAKLSPKELLLETQRAIDLNLLKQHEELIEKDNKRFELVKQYEARKDQKELLEKKKVEFEEEAKKYEEFQKKEHELKLHEKLIPYAQIQDLKYERERLKTVRDEAEVELKEFLSTTQPFVNAANAYDNELQDFTNLLHDDVEKYGKFEPQAVAIGKKIQAIDNQRNLIAAKIEGFEARKQSKLKDLEKCRNYIQETISKRDNLQGYDEDEIAEAEKSADALIKKIENVDGDIVEYEGKLQESEGAVKRVTRKITGFEQELKSNDRLHILNNNNNKTISNTYTGVRALRSDLKHMRGKVFEPPCLSVTTTHPRYADYLEELLDFNTTFAFTCADKDTFDQISHEFYDVKKVKVGLRRISNKKLSRKLSEQQLADLGFDGYIADFMKGPQAVIQMLSEEKFVHDIPVSKTALSENEVKFLTESRDQNGQLYFRKFIAGDTMYNLQISRYGSRQVLLNTSRIKPARNFSADGIDEDRRRHLIRQLNEAKTEKESLENQLQPIKEQVGDFKREKRDLDEQLIAYNTSIRKAKSIENERARISLKIESLEGNAATLEAESQKDYTREIITHERKIKGLLLTKLKYLKELSDLQIEYNQLAENLTLLKVKKFEIENKKNTMKKLTRNFENTKRELQDKFDSAKRDLQNFKNNELRKKLQDEIATYTPEIKAELKVLVDKYADKFTEAHINDVIHSLNASLKLLGNSSKSSLNNFEKLKSELEALDKELSEYEGVLEDLNSSIIKIHRDWEPSLEELVTKISHKFSSIFPTVGIAGDVKIAKDERYQEWKLQILVKFREQSEFKVLDAHTQSGGERAVSTVYYMISMQELTNSPFRAVDEINQGMDERNERIVHKHMVETACLEHTSQYFLITPKLLTGLYYAENMRIHCIMAGPWTPNTIENPEYLSLGETSNYVY